MLTQTFPAQASYLEAAENAYALGQQLAARDQGEFEVVLPDGEILRCFTRKQALTTRRLLGGLMRYDQDYVERSVRRAFADYEIVTEWV